MIAAILPDTFTAASHGLEHKSAQSTFIEWQKKNPITHYHSLYNTLSLSQHWETTSLLSVSIDHKELLKNCGKTYMTQNVPF